MQEAEGNRENAALTSQSSKGIKSPEQPLNRGRKAEIRKRSEKNAKLKRVVLELSC